MSESVLNIKKKVELTEPVLVEGLPGIGYVGKLATDHLIEELDAEKFAEMTSSHFPHHVTVNSDGLLNLVKINFYHVNVGGRDFVIVGGDVQATSSEGHYKVTRKLLDFAEELGVSSIFTLGGYATGKHSSKKPRVIGASNEDDILEGFREYGVDIEEGFGPILGISGLLLGMGKARGLEGSALLGETHGMVVDHRSAQAVLEALTDILDIEIDMSELKERAKKTEDILSRLRKAQKLQEAGGVEEEEEPSYIG